MVRRISFPALARTGLRRGLSSTANPYSFPSSVAVSILTRFLGLGAGLAFPAGGLYLALGRGNPGQSGTAWTELPGAYSRKLLSPASWAPPSQDDGALVAWADYTVTTEWTKLAAMGEDPVDFWALCLSSVVGTDDVVYSAPFTDKVGVGRVEVPQVLPADGEKFKVAGGALRVELSTAVICRESAKNILRYFLGVDPTVMDQGTPVWLRPFNGDPGPTGDVAGELSPGAASKNPAAGAWTVFAQATGPARAIMGTRTDWTPPTAWTDVTHIAIAKSSVGANLKARIPLVTPVGRVEATDTFGLESLELALD